MHAMTNLGRRWTLEEEEFIWRNRGRLTARAMGVQVNRSAAAVLDRLALLRELEQQHTATPERQAVTDEVCRYLRWRSWPAAYPGKKPNAACKTCARSWTNQTSSSCVDRTGHCGAGWNSSAADART